MIGLFHWYCSNIFLLFLNTYILAMIELFNWYCSNILFIFLNTYILGMIGLFLDIVEFFLSNTYQLVICEANRKHWSVEQQGGEIERVDWYTAMVQ